MTELEDVEQKIQAGRQAELFDKLRQYVSASVLEAMKRIPREKFVHPKLINQAYLDEPVPILETPDPEKPEELVERQDTSLSQPFTIGVMTDMLDVRPENSVLEIGTATGYQAAILSKLARSVTTVDIDLNLVLDAKKRLQELGIENVHCAVADGSQSFTPAQSFDRIIVTAAVPPTPPYYPLLDLLSEHGKAVLPLGGIQGDPIQAQMLVISRDPEKGFRIEKQMLGFGFVPMQGERGWNHFYDLMGQVFHENFTQKMGGKSLAELGQERLDELERLTQEAEKK